MGDLFAEVLDSVRGAWFKRRDHRLGPVQLVETDCLGRGSNLLVSELLDGGMMKTTHGWLPPTLSRSRDFVSAFAGLPVGDVRARWKAVCRRSVLGTIATTLTKTFSGQKKFAYE